MPVQQQQQETPRARGSSPAMVGDFKPFESDSGAVHHPPWFGWTLGMVGIVSGICANLWQIATSVIAFFGMFVAGSVYRSLSIHGQATATTGVLLVSIGMSISFQLGVLFFVFRLHQEFKEAKVKVGDSMQAVKATAVQMVSHHRLLLAWSVISFVMDTVGDFQFIGTLTDEVFLTLMYTLSLYAVSTIILSVSLERHWASKVSFQNWKAYKAYTDLMRLKGSLAKSESATKEG